MQWCDKRSGKDRAPMMSTPPFSVIIPTHNRSQLLLRCLTSLMPTVCALKAEVVVVDDGSDDGTIDHVRAFVCASGVKEFVQLVISPHAGPAAARNLGIAVARGAAIAFTDDDCMPTSPWPVANIAALRTNAYAGVGGRVLPLGVHAIARYMRHIRALSPGYAETGDVA